MFILSFTNTSKILKKKIDNIKARGGDEVVFYSKRFACFQMKRNVNNFNSFDKVIFSCVKKGDLKINFCRLRGQ